MRKVIIHAVGWTFILIGVAGLVLPVLQGVLFICVGLLILAQEVPWAERLLARIKKKYPKVGNVLEGATLYMQNELSRIRTERGYIWKRLPVFLLVLVVLAVISWGLSLLFSWLKGIIWP